MANAYGSTTALSGNANSLSPGSYVSMGVIDFGSAPPHACFVDFIFQAGSTPSGNKSVVVYARAAIDGSAFSDAPSSTTIKNSVPVAFVDLPDSSAHHARPVDLSLLFGALPQKVELYAYNDAGVALNASGNTGQYRTVTFG